MPSYVMLARFTEQGIKDVKGSVDRGARFQQAVEAAGGASGRSTGRRAPTTS